MLPRKNMRTHSFLSSIVGSDGGTRTFLSSISWFGKLIFLISFIASIWIMIDNNNGMFFHFEIILSLGIALVVTFIFELIYGLFRNKSNLG